MTTMKSALRTVAGVALAASMATAAFADDYTLKVAGVVPVDHIGHKILEEIAADIEAADVGLTVKVFPAGQLGSGEELLEDTIRGNIDIVHAFVYAHKDPVLEINSLPFLVTNWDEMERVYGSKDSEYSKIMTEVLDRLGLVFLNNVAEGPIGVVSTKRPDNYATVDPKNINIRVWSSNVAKAATESIGYNTTTMNWAEVFPAIQAGAVDGAICCTAQLTYTNFALSDVGQYFIPYNAFVEASTYYASKRTWEKLNDAQRAAIQAAVDKGAAAYTKYSRENDAGFIEKLKEKGWEVLEITDDQRAAITDHIKAEVWPMVAETIGQETIDRLSNDK